MITTLLSLYAGSFFLGGPMAGPLPSTVDWPQTTNQAIVYPLKKPEAIAPVIEAKAAIAVDLESGLILYEKNIYQPLAIASLTKLMTALIILEENNLDDVVTVSRTSSRTEGSKIWLAPGEKITVENLLYATLIHSANDAAVALAEYNSQNIDAFVEKMNKKSKEYKLFSTTFFNPTGLDEETNSNENAQQPAGTETEAPLLKDNTSTAYDLALLSKYVIGKSFIRRATVKTEHEISSVDGKLKHPLKSTNELLKSYLKVLGLKTGTTDQAGQCLIAIIENNQGKDILTIVLHSPNRYDETKLLSDWVFKSYQWQ